MPPEKPPLADVDFDQAPFVIFWEVTRACALACRHCRAKAQPRRDPRELTTAEGFNLIDQIAKLGNPVFIFTGGDPLMRSDIFDLISYAIEKGLRVSLAPSATKLVTQQRLAKVKAAGLARVSYSLDGATAETHDAFRQIPGSFVRTLEIIKTTKDVGLSFQLNTTVTRYSADALKALAEMVSEMGAVLWDVFFLVPTGRGQTEDMVSPEKHEEIFHWLYQLSKTAPFDIKTTAAQPYRRVVIQENRRERSESLEELIAPGFHYRDDVSRSPKGVNDGNGCCFISHIGEVSPSGFLPLVAGNVRQEPLAQIYRHSPIFRDLRDVSKLKGKCGRCEYKTVCGGSRARAYAVTGDYLEAEPCCVYQPKSVLATTRN
ncbi:MAG: TIGR04053 family radical SAM/SPASM domain-containing protein [Chloroflexi bacterium]|nr:TIGR04053 family radical SAM/SPASM domain-containing protein [Chloroflexota bacterium]